MIPPKISRRVKMQIFKNQLRRYLLAVVTTSTNEEIHTITLGKKQKSQNEGSLSHLSDEPIAKNLNRSTDSLRTSVIRLRLKLNMYTLYILLSTIYFYIFVSI